MSNQCLVAIQENVHIHICWRMCFRGQHTRIAWLGHHHQLVSLVSLQATVRTLDHSNADFRFLFNESKRILCVCFIYISIFQKSEYFCFCIFEKSLFNFNRSVAPVLLRSLIALACRLARLGGHSVNLPPHLSLFLSFKSHMQTSGYSWLTGSFECWHICDSITIETL